MEDDSQSDGGAPARVGLSRTVKVGGTWHAITTAVTTAVITAVTTVSLRLHWLRLCLLQGAQEEEAGEVHECSALLDGTVVVPARSRHGAVLSACMRHTHAAHAGGMRTGSRAWAA